MKDTLDLTKAKRIVPKIACIEDGELLEEDRCLHCDCYYFDNEHLGEYCFSGVGELKKRFWDV